MTAYFSELGTFETKDLEALLGYYLQLLRRSPVVYRYICDKRKSFEHLSALLGKIKEMTEGLFVYGTLHPDRAPLEIRPVVERMRAISSATIAGTVYDLGEFPAFLPKEGRSKVHGTLFALPDDPNALNALDAYEEYFPGNPAKSLFVRQKRTVTLEDGRKQRHWVYVYNRAIPVGTFPMQHVPSAAHFCIDLAKRATN